MNRDEVDLEDDNQPLLFGRDGEKTRTTTDYDEVVEQLGGFGKYQKKVYLLMFVPTMSIAIQTLMTVFSMKTPDHR